ncbi:hypothetical protein HDV06_004247 [Boothiomyces sp. JEL0866]|nr:hypothetical protein HDV06_004247 [Boothiomyces sp. JEL0866]
MSINELPTEIYEIIFSCLDEPFRLSPVCKQWDYILKNVKKMVIRATPRVDKYGLMNILDKYSNLEKLHLTVCESFIEGNHPYLHHKIAQQFTGHRKLSSIVSSSDLIMFGVFNCHNLRHLTLQENTYYGEEIKVYNTMDLHKRRNLGYIISSLPNLETLSIDSPTMWSETPSYEELATFNNSQLKKLVIKSLDSFAMNNIFNLLNNGGKLSHLQHLIIDFCHHNLEKHFIDALAFSCPQLAKLQMKYGSLHVETLQDICEKLTNLNLLKFSRCDIPVISTDWAATLAYISERLCLLTTLSFNHCTIIGEYHRFSLTPQPNSRLTYLKLFDTQNTRPTDEMITKILQLFPNLSKLRLDLDSYYFPGQNIDDQISICKSLTSAEIIELRFGRISGEGSADSKEIIDFVCPKLRNLSLWGFYTFPDFIITPNSINLKKLSLNYSLNPPQGAFYDMPNLESLHIKSITHLAQSICLSTIKSLVANSKKLQSLSIEAMNSDIYYFDDQILRTLMQNCPKLKEFKCFQFRFTLHSLQLFLDNWHSLTTLAISGQKSIDVLNENMDATFVLPLLAKRRLRTFILSVSGILQEKLDFQSEDNSVEKFAIYRQYERKIKAMFPNLQTIKILGPVEYIYHRRMII